MLTGEQFAEEMKELARVALEMSLKHPEFVPRDAVPPGVDQQPSIAMRVRGALGPDAARLVVELEAYADALVNAKTGANFMATGGGTLVPDALRQSKDANVLYVEILTAVALALYYLGVPDGRPWDIVLQWTEVHGGGLPNGICVGKAIGDLVRASRRAHMACRRGDDCMQAGDLLVHSYLPMVIFPRLIDKKVPHEDPDGPPLPDYLHKLGRCYEYMQLRLYATEGFPFLYTAPKSFIEECMLQDWHAQKATNPTVTKRQVFDTMRSALRARLRGSVALPVDTASRQRVVVVPFDRPPACFVNDSSGLFTFEGMDPQDRQQDLPLPASYMRADRRERYQQRLTKGEPSDGAGNLLSLDEGIADRTFELLFPGEKNVQPQSSVT